MGYGSMWGFNVALLPSLSIAFIFRNKEKLNSIASLIHFP